MDSQKECSQQMNSNCLVNSHQFNGNSVNLSQLSPKLLKSGNCTNNNETYKSNVNPSLTSNKLMFTTYCSTNAHVTSVVPIVASLASNSINSTSGLTNNLENTKSTTSFPGSYLNSCVNNTTNVNNSNPLTYILLPQNSYVPYCTLHRNNHNNSLQRSVMTPESSLACQLSPNINQHYTLTSGLNNIPASSSSGRESRVSNNHDESIDYSTTSKEKNTLPPIYSSKKNSCRSPEGSPSLKLKNYQFFNRFRMHSSKANGKTRSANNSPLLSSSFSPTMYRNTLVNKSSHSRTYSDCSPVVQPTNVKLIDTYLIKGPSGFGLTLTGVLTFIPNGMLDVHIVSDQFNTQDGFFQRLLQIRSVSDDVITCDNDLIQSHTKQPVIRPGDILLAAGGYRFAGCTPEYAVQLLSRIPTGGIVQVTLLRGLSIPTYQCANEMNYYRYHSHGPRSSSLCSSVSSSSEVSPNKTNSDHEAQNKSNFVQSHLKNFCSNCRDSIRTITLFKKENDYGFTYVYTNYGCLVNQVNTNESNNSSNPKLQTGDLIIKLGNFDLTKVTKSQFLQLFGIYTKAKSIQITVIRVCTNCLNKLNYYSPISILKEDDHNDPRTSLNKGEKTVTKSTDRSEMLSFLRTVLNTSSHFKKSSNHNPQIKDKPNEKHTTTTTTTTTINNNNTTTTTTHNNSHTTVQQLNQTIAPWLPDQCIIPGIGMSGPCETPDYIPVSELLNKSKVSICQNNNAYYLNGAHKHQQAQMPNDLIQQCVNSASVQQSSLPLKDNNNNSNSSCNGLLQSALLSSTASVTAQVNGLHSPMEKNTNSPTEKDVKILYIPNEGKLKFTKENAEQNFPSIIPLSINAQIQNESNQNLVVGDLLVAIENQPVLNCKPNEIEELIQLAAKKNKGFVTLTVRKIHSTEKCESAKISETTADNFINFNIINVKLTKNKDEGFGFVIVTSLNNEKTSEIGRIIPGSPAEKCGQLEVGQRILAINGYWLTGINHIDIVNLIRQSQQELLLTVEKSGALFSERSNNLAGRLDTNQNTLSLPTSTNSVVCPHSVSFLKSDEVSHFTNIS
uniref:PDZ domain-containing protein n=1 Tax=Trichobilharzia regenti TaxID=157069 RepID=A0AA85JQ28_TRIRE|nr:unnamed protein product [Trichobilharzia regenti]